MGRSIICAFLVTVACASSSAAQTAARQVLLLNSFERGAAAENQFAGLLRSELARQSAQAINFFEVSLQPALAPDDPREQPIVEYLRSTFGQRLDLVVTLGGPAAEFAQRHRPEIFRTTPLLITAMDHRWVQGRTLSANETALGSVTDPERIIEDILRLLPETRQVFVIIGASQIETFWRGELSRRFLPFEDRLTFVWANDLSYQEMLERSAALPAHSAIFYTLLAVDANGVAQEEERTLAELRSRANAPMFGLYDLQLGKGIVGGSLLSIESTARNAASIAVRVLRGESPGEIKTAPETHGGPTFDWRELQRWGISAARLPPESVIRFRPPSLWNQYKGYIVGAAALLMLQSALIARLVFQGTRRRRAELRLRHLFEQNQDLAGRLIHAQEAERARLARELHDDLSQQLAGVGIMLSGLKRKIGRPDLQSDVDQAVRHLQQRTSALADSVRDLSHRLHPSVLEHSGLSAALQRHCADIERDHDLTVTFSTCVDVDSLNPEVALCLFRVAQEALSNAVRHARARQISVQVRTTTEGVELDVIDDGVGFVLRERAGNGLGLRSIEERVRITSGTVKVESQPGQGTKMQVRIPTLLAHQQIDVVRTS
jgi:signal transduction histidine kinase